MITTLLFAGLMAVQGDAWDLKPTYTKGKKLVWATEINAKLQGQDHVAKTDVTLIPGEVQPDGTMKATFAWEKLELDGNPMEQEATYVLLLGANGVVTDKTGSDDDNVRRWASIYSFAYPKTPVKVGDKWDVEIKPTTKDAPKINYAFEAKEVTKIGDKEVLKVTSTETEAGADGLTNNATWYIAHDGTIVQFKLEVKNWLVPFAGTGPLEAVISGTFKP